MTKHTENKTIDWRERYNKKFNTASFIWNGDNTMGIHFAEAENKKMKRFIAKEIKLALKQRTESLIEEIEKEINYLETGDNDWNNLDYKTGYELALQEVKKFLKSKYLKQEESSKRG